MIFSFHKSHFLSKLCVKKASITGKRNKLFYCSKTQKTYSEPDAQPELSKWLESLGLSQYLSSFKKYGYTNSLAWENLEEEDLDVLGILPTHRHALRSKSAENTPRKENKSRSKRQLDDSYWQRVKYKNTSAEALTDLDKPMKLFLVRHGQSMANLDKTLHMKMADHAIPLSSLGEIQAAEVGKYIKSHFQTAHKTEHPPPKWHCRIWTSPYYRARQTSYIIRENSEGWITDVQENIFFVEQQFGLFEGTDWNATPGGKFKKEIMYYDKCASYGGRFWASVPLGESRFDVCRRVHQGCTYIHRDVIHYGTQNAIIVAHGVTLRAITMMWLNLNPEWFEEERNPVNCSIRLLENGVDKGYIWPTNANATIPKTIKQYIIQSDIEANNVVPNPDILEVSLNLKQGVVPQD
eukprot:TRINITY_DN9593_c0_g1_i1.p1 TRINITY_DN9593_c0_g1~~TRINITY_DN9593_c0_g1_i1.p1  ORF type:complete len:408 (-),score=60.85 TRINITY_DN9593_c0_g1_i1:89-1312(-)